MQIRRSQNDEFSTKRWTLETPGVVTCRSFRLHGTGRWKIVKQNWQRGNISLTTFYQTLTLSDDGLAYLNRNDEITRRKPHQCRPSSCQNFPSETNIASELFLLQNSHDLVAASPFQRSSATCNVERFRFFSRSRRRHFS